MLILTIVEVMVVVVVEEVDMIQEDGMVEEEVTITKCLRAVVEIDDDYVLKLER